MAKKPKGIYVACSLTHASADFVDSVEQLKTALRTEGYEIMDFLGVVNGTPADVYKWDIGHCVRGCDALVAICDHPSIGMGFEINEALRLHKPVLAIAQDDAKVTRLVLGAAETEPNMEFARYKDLSLDGVKLVDNWLKTIIS